MCDRLGYEKNRVKLDIRKEYYSPLVFILSKDTPDTQDGLLVLTPTKTLEEFERRS